MSYSTKLEVEGPKRRRKRDSSALFDISLDDLTEPDHSGTLREKHSGKEWWCVLQDQHLCMFPSQNPQELAYDVLLVSCCEISLDDVYAESPVFRLTQVGSTPWVFSAGIERNLRAWIRALYRACGKDDMFSRSDGKKSSRRAEKMQKKGNMKVFSTTIAETEEEEEKEEQVEGNEDKDEKYQENHLNIERRESEKQTEEGEEAKDDCHGSDVTANNKDLPGNNQEIVVENSVLLEVNLFKPKSPS